MNGYASKKFKNKNLLDINGHPCTHGSIVGFINIYRFINCSNEEHPNDKEFFMKRKASSFVGVHAMHILFYSDELSINYNFSKPPIACQRNITLGLHLDISLGLRKSPLHNCIFGFSIELMENYC